MYHIVNDRRAYRSVEKLVAAAERILLDREPQKLTVSLLCEESGVSRATFYRLFDEPVDVLRYDADTKLHDLVGGYVELIARAKRHDLSVPAPARWYADGVRRNADVIVGLIRAGQGTLLKEAHKKALCEFAPVLFPDLEAESDEFRFFVELRSGLFLSAVTAWEETGRTATMDDILRFMQRQLKMIAQES